LCLSCKIAGTQYLHFMLWCSLRCLSPIIATLTQLGIIITVVNDFVYVPNFKYISVMPPACDCVVICTSETRGTVKKIAPRDPRVVYVLTS